MKKLTLVLLLNAAGQFLAGILLLIGLENTLPGTIHPIIRAGVGLILLSSLFAVVGIFVAGRYQNKNHEESMRHLEALNGKLREQKHDLMNHFQVVYGLMEMEEYGEAHT